MASMPDKKQQQTKQGAQINTLNSLVPSGGKHDSEIVFNLVSHVQ